MPQKFVVVSFAGPPQLTGLLQSLVAETIDLSLAIGDVMLRRVNTHQKPG